MDPIVEEFEKLNKMFQAQSAFEASWAYDNLLRYFKSLKRRVIKSSPSGDHLLFHEVDFRASFLNECSKYEHGKGDKEKNKIVDVKDRCWAFLLRIVEETNKRLPANLECFEKMNYFKPNNVISGKIKFSALPFIENLSNDESNILEE